MIKLRFVHSIHSYCSLLRRALFVSQGGLERGEKKARGRPPRAFCFSILLGCPVGAYAEERVLSGSLNECWPHTCDACVLKNNLEIRIGGSYRRPELFFGAIYRFHFCNKKLLANPRSPTFLVRGIRQAKYPVKKFN